MVTLLRLLAAVVLWVGVWLVCGCSAGSISPGDEPAGEEEQQVEPDGADEGTADRDGGLEDGGDLAGDSTAGDGDGYGDGNGDGDGYGDGNGDGDGYGDGNGDGNGYGDGDGDGDGQGQADEGTGAEMLLFDGEGRQFSYDDSGFHVLIEPGDDLPADDWLAPHDYYQGEFHVRYVISAPADQAAGRLQTCIWTMGDDGVGGNYFPESCGQQVSHSGVGSYEVTNNLCPADWWKKDGVPLDYAHPERFLIRVVLRGESGCNVTRYDVPGACWDQWPAYENMMFRVTIVMVPVGATFSGWDAYP